MDEKIRKRYGDSKNVPGTWIKRRRKRDDPEQHDDPNYVPPIEQPASTYYEDEETGKAHEQPEVDDIPDLDLYLNAEVLLPQDGEYMKAARVIGRATNNDGEPVGMYDSNPILNTRVYDVMFPDGSIQQYSANGE